ncbi:primosomal protein N' [Nonomuraea typhae]|uniref:Probable replication restart protein PriA n=1 Tax=Nonomuraea typhae TaxID=2603600 RepID=A0ABW7YPG8_9ACTN
MSETDHALLPLEAVRPADRRGAGQAKGSLRPAPGLPVARVAVDNPLPHLDRPFDYLVPESMHESAQPGVRVRVRFAGKLVDGFLLERAEESEHPGKLAPLERVVSAERVLTAEVAGLARAVADRYAGTLADVLRLAVPPRHARAEAETPAEPEPQPEGPPAGAWDAYPMGASFLDALEHGRAPRAVWSALPGAAGWAEPVAEAVRATLAGGRGALVVVPDGKDVALADEVFGRVLGSGAHVALTAGLGPAERYRRWLRVLRGQARAVLGTRAAVFAPVADLGLAAIWDDGDDLHAERLSPYPHAREVLALRAHRTGAAMLIGGYARTAEATQLIASGWARPIVAARESVRVVAPRVKPAGEDAELAKDQAARAARLPSVAWRALREGLESGPVLVQVPRRGYLPSIACRQCRRPARCALPPTRVAAAQTRIGEDIRGVSGLLGGSGLLAVPEGLGPADPGRLGGSGLLAVPEGLGSADPGRLGGPGRPAAPERLGGSGHPAVPGGAGGSGHPALPERHGVPGRPGGSGMSESSGMPRGMPGGSGVSGRGACHGPLALRSGHGAPHCRWCGRVDAAWRCAHCGSPHVRAVVVGARRTAEELGRAFPSVPVKTSGRDGVLDRVGEGRALVVATPGAEPVAEGGYAAAVLLDGWALLGRADLRAAEEGVRRWMNAAALLRPAAELVVLADMGLPAVQALVRWDPVTHAERELADRAELGFPPAVRMATLTGTAAAVRQMLEEVRLPEEAQVLGPVPVGDDGQERAMIRVPRASGGVLAAALKGANGVRAARKAPDVVRVSVDPLELI